MRLGFGKHKDKSVETLVLKFPDYVNWVLDQRDPSSVLIPVADEIWRLIEILDAKPIVSRCSGINCKRAPTKFTAYRGNSVLLYPWCDACDPAWAGADPPKLVDLQTYWEALRFVDGVCGGTKASYRSIIRSLAEHKGLPRRCGEKQAEAFFTQTVDRSVGGSKQQEAIG